MEITSENVRDSPFNNKHHLPSFPPWIFLLCLQLWRWKTKSSMQQGLYMTFSQNSQTQRLSSWNKILLHYTQIYDTPVKSGPQVVLIQILHKFLLSFIIWHPFDKCHEIPKLSKTLTRNVTFPKTFQHWKTAPWFPQIFKDHMNPASRSCIKRQRQQASPITHQANSSALDQRQDT